MARRDRFSKSPWSVFLRIEELILASSGADAFEVTYALVAERLGARAPQLAALPDLGVPDATLEAVRGLLGHAGLEGDAEGIDALFEQLVTRVGKGQKGQFFTPRHVVHFAVSALGVSKGEHFLDPACGSGAFALHARRRGSLARGFDIDARAIRVAKLLAIATDGDPDLFVRLDSLSQEARRRVPRADVVATNPPFAGAPNAEGFEVAKLGGNRVERDALFLERCVEWLRPGGRLAIVLPHGLVASRGSAPLRAWLIERMRVFAVVSLPPETFLPHTSQRTVLLLAKKRRRPTPKDSERTFFAVSQRAGTLPSGEPLFMPNPSATRRTWRDRDHDLDSIARPLHAFLSKEGFSKPQRGKRRDGSPASSYVVRTLHELGPWLPLAPERHRLPECVRHDASETRGVLLSELVDEVHGRRPLVKGEPTIVLDTSHVREGHIELPEPQLRAGSKVPVPRGAVLVSRLRPYLRQVAWVSPCLFGADSVGKASLMCSTEFSVLVPKKGGRERGSLAFLVPFLLSVEVQERLKLAQEGGHRPRVPREALLSLYVPEGTIQKRRESSEKVEQALAKLYAAKRRYRRVLGARPRRP
jgi:type I restriction enzyme M protein